MTEVLLEGLRFGEGPRWHDGRLWFSDMHSQRVLAVDDEGKLETIVEVPQEPSGLGWLPDGRLLVEIASNSSRIARAINASCATSVHTVALMPPASV